MLNYSANGPSGYNLTNSLRFRSSASAYLSRTFTTPTDGKKWTWSGWVKRGILTNGTGTVQQLFSAGSATGFFRFSQTDTLLAGWTGAANLETTQVFRDPSAWYHIMLVVDTTQATAANRVKYYVNGSQITSFATTDYPTQNSTTTINSAVAHNIAAYTSSSQYFDGYLTEINFVDGQALTPSSFGNTNSTTGVWQPAKYTGTYGTNGFYLKFADTSAATAAAIGKDSSGNGNNWTPNNISVTAGVTYDAMTDVPTLTSATVGNYPTLNPLNPFKTYVTLSNANLTATGNSAVNTDTVYSTMGSLSTSIYWEYTCVTVGSSYGRTGAITIFPTSAGGVPGEAPLGGFCWRQDGYLVTPSSTTLVLPTFTTNDVLGYALNPTAGTCALYKNGSLVYTVTGLSTTSTFFPATAEYNGSVGAYNFGQRPFIYTPPSGFVALNTFNLPSSTIPQGNKYMDATTYTGTNGSPTTQVISSNFQPDFLWFKKRSGAYDHALIDTNRGITKQLYSNLTNAEGTDSDVLTAIGASSFTVGNSNYSNYGTLVAWTWKANGGTTSSNTSGSITSTVQANATAGFSVVTYTGTGSNATVGHGLGVAPSMFIVKARSVGGQDWDVYHAFLGATKRLFLNSTAAAQTSSAPWNNTAPTSSVFSIGTGSDVNTSSVTYLAYCWAEIAGFSKFGSYTGNNSNDGPFVYCNFRPKYVIVKSTSNSHWAIFDTARQTYNVIGNTLWAESSAAEQTGTYPNQIDILSNGFKMRSDDANSWPGNASGVTYIYMAFAENPFKNANAR